MTGQCSALQNEMSDTVGVIFLFFNGDKRKPSVTSLHCVKHTILPFTHFYLVD